MTNTLNERAVSKYVCSKRKKYDLICKSFKKYIPAVLLYCYYVLYFIFNLRNESYIITSSFIYQ